MCHRLERVSKALGLGRFFVSSMLESGKFEKLLVQGFHVAASMTVERASISEALDDKAPVCLQKTTNKQTKLWVKYGC